MFEIALEVLSDFIAIVPLAVCLILVFNLIAYLLWGGNQ